jgi:hypothetical protein
VYESIRRKNIEKTKIDDDHLCGKKDGLKGLLQHKQRGSFVSPRNISQRKVYEHARRTAQQHRKQSQNFGR